MTGRARRTEWMVAAAVAGVTIVAFLPTLHNGFVAWDDDKNFLNNPDYRGLGLPQLRWMWTTFLLGHYVPLAWMSLGLDYLLWGMRPAGYHLTSLLIHAATAVLVFRIALRLLPTGHGRMGAAAFAALVFAVHPLRVESVAWATERRDVLCGCFYFAAVLSYLRYAAGDGRRWYGITLLLAACAMLSKGTAVTLPLLLAVLCVYPLRRAGPPFGPRSGATRRVLAELAPLIVMAALTGVIALVALPGRAQLGAGAKIAVSAYSLAFYIWKAVAPAGLSPMYAMPAVVDATSARFLAAYATIALVSITVFAFRRRWPALAVAWVAFVAVEAPMLGVHQNGLQIAADRYTYFAGPIVAMVAALALLTLASRIAPRAAAGVGTAVVAALAAATWRQTGVWHDTRSLWTRAIAVDERSAFAQNSLAGLLLEDDSVPAAIDHFTRALAAEPDYPQAHNGLGIALGRLGRTDEAIAHFQRALAVDPGYDEPAGNWGVLLARSGDVPGAIVRFEQALAINPHDADIRVNLGNAYVRIGRFDDAIAQYREAVHIRPDDADAHYNWGVALAQQSKLDDAVAEFEAALRARPDHADAREALGRAQRLLRAAGPPDDYAADALSVTTRTSLSAT